MSKSGEFSCYVNCLWRVAGLETQFMAIETLTAIILEGVTFHFPSGKKIMHCSGLITQEREACAATQRPKFDLQLRWRGSLNAESGECNILLRLVCWIQSTSGVQILPVIRLSGS